ncbi:MAG: asparagine synthase (glutamine-hydrolyzing) [Planctomycetes bacterium]|nr:asparagine synthase (glutamine-hydrolyzing) [Planctomycetota bacterium]
MCGIAGYVDFASRRPSPEILESMTRSLRHRGPDASGVLVDGPCGLAHTRLSIIDLEGSAQPMRVAASAIALVFNGEIYNYRELRSKLVSAGIGFETNGDTEVLLRCVDGEWTDALSRFDGMFAFAAWDRVRERLLLARDPFGKKPLFFATPSRGTLVFGSEIKAVLQHPAVDRELDADALRQALRFRAVYGVRSLYRGVRQLEPGCFIEFDADGVRAGRYFDLSEQVALARETMHGLDDDALVREGGRIFEGAVRKRLIADVPVGAFLSGGLDSSLVVAVMRALRAPEEEVRTFSVGFRNDPGDELPHARLVAQTLGTRHTEVPLTESDYQSSFADLTACRDAPISEPADLAIARMSEVARRTVKVVLSGEGSDEAFCGYPKYAFARMPGALRAGIRFLGPERVATFAARLGLDRRRALVAARALAPTNELSRLVQWFSDFDRMTLRTLLPGLDWSDDNWRETTRSQREALDRTRRIGASAVVRMQAVDCLTWLPCNLLERGDRMTMAAGLEARVPFLDKQLVPFGLALPDRFKVRGRTLKWIVRQWARDRIPPSIVRRPKWGFRVPLASWFRGDMRPMLFDYLTNPRGVCGTWGDSRRVQALLESHDSGRADASLALWTLLATELWYQDVFLNARVAHFRPAPDARIAHLA